MRKLFSIVLCVVALSVSAFCSTSPTYAQLSTPAQPVARVEHGRGGPADPVEAARLWRLAASKDYAPANEHLTLLAAAAAAKAAPQGAGTFAIPLLRQSGGWLVAANIDEVINVNFILDSGATITTFPESVAKLLGIYSLPEVKSAVTQVGRLANGATVTGKTFAIRSLRMGDKTIRNVQSRSFPAMARRYLGRTSSRCSAPGRSTTTGNCSC